MDVKVISTGLYGASAATLDSMHDGERLRTLLERHGKKGIDLQNALKKSRQTVHIYFTTPRYSAHIRDTILRGLERLGIDPDEFTEDPTSITDPDELRHLLDKIPHEALIDLRTMMSIKDRATRMAIIAIISDRIERKR